MLNLDLYIHSTGSIGPAADVTLPVTRLLASEPDYTSFIPPMQLRRMSKVVRMGIGAARAAMLGAGIEQPDAISVGTAFGCLQDTEVFLSKMVAQEEQMLTPTAFIQSTHNTVGGQIALLAGCRGHNMTYVHSGHSFEHALINSSLYLQDHKGEQVLTGGIDELTETSYSLMQRIGFYSNLALSPAGLSHSVAKGTIAGEGASFFVTGRQAAGALLRISRLYLFNAATPSDAYMHVSPLMPALGSADLVVQGKNGDEHNTQFYDRLQETYFAGIPTAAFKQFCGEYATAGAYGLSLLTGVLATQQFPDHFLQQGRPERLQRMILLNHYCSCYSCWVLEAV